MKPKRNYKTVATLSFNTAFEVRIDVDRYNEMKVKDWNRLKDDFELININKRFPLEKFLLEKLQSMLPEGVSVINLNEREEWK